VKLNGFPASAAWVVKSIACAPVLSAAIAAGAATTASENATNDEISADLRKDMAMLRFGWGMDLALQ